MVTGELPDPFEQLVAFGRRPDAKIRPVLLRVLVDMFVSKPEHNPSDIRQFEEIMVHLLDDADDPSRLAVAEQLARHPSTPPALLDRFVAERGAIAAKVLAHAGMDSRALSAAAVFGTTVMATAVARRPDLDPAVVRSLAERPEIEVLCALVENRAVTIDRPLFRYLARRAEGHPDLAGRLLERSQSGEMVSPFLAAGRDERAALIASARRQDLGMTGRAPPSAGLAGTTAAIEHAARTPGLDGLDIILAAALQCAPHEMARLIDDPHGEPLALALAALGVSTEVAARVFILGPPAISHSYEKVKALLQIVETVSTRAAYKLVCGMLGRPADIHRRPQLPPEAPEVNRRPEPVAPRRENPLKVAALRRATQSG